jgi:hypothetical protein
MVDETAALLNAWRSSPEPARALVLCRALAMRVGDSYEHRRVLSEVAPVIASHYPREVEVQLTLGRACLTACDYFSADAVLKPLLQVAPNEPHVWRLLGEVFLRAGNARDAETAFEGAIARGMRDVETMRWHEKARGVRPLQDAGGHEAVAAEIVRWTASWAQGSRVVQAPPAMVPAPAYVAPSPAPAYPAPAPSPAPAYAPPGPSTEEAPDLGRTIVREPTLADLARAMGREVPQAPPAEPPPPDSERTAFYQKPAHEVASDSEREAREQEAPRPANRIFTGGAPAPAPAAPAGAAPGGGGILDEQSMDIDVLKLPEGEKLDEVLEALRKSEGVVIEEPTAFMQLPASPESRAPSERPPAPQVAPNQATIMMPVQVDLTPPPPRPAAGMSTTGPLPAPMAQQAASNPLSGPPAGQLANAVLHSLGDTSSAPPAPDGTLPLPGAKPSGAPIEAPKKRGGGIWILLVLLIAAIGGGGWYFLRWRAAKAAVDEARKAAPEAAP